MHKNLDVQSIGNGIFHIKVGAVNFQIDKRHMEVLSIKMAAELDSNIIEEKELQKIFEKYEALNIPKAPILCIKNANANSTKEKPLG